MSRIRYSAAVCVSALCAGLVGGAAWAQTTPGDHSGTPQAAGTGQSAASSTNAPAETAEQPSRRNASSGSDTGDIIVTARRVEERLQDVPISITVFNQQQLQNRNVSSAVDLATFTPSLSADTSFGQDNTSYALRGFVQDIGTAPSVGVYFADVVAARGASNGIPSGDGAGPGYFFDLQNVQVLKGPQGTLFGRNTTGGAILFVPQKPTSKTEGYVEGSIGNFDLRRVQGAINIPFGDSFRARIAVDHQQRDGYLKNNGTGNIGPDRFGDIDYTAVRASFVADLTPDLENYTIVSYSHSKNNGSFQKLYLVDPVFSLGQLGNAQLNGSPVSSPTQNGGFYDVAQDIPNPVTRISQWQVLNTTTWRASDTITVKNIVSYAQFTQDYLNPIFGTNLVAPAILNLLGFKVGPNFAIANPLPGGHSADQNTFTEELQLQGRSADDRLTYQGGGYLEVSEPLSQVGSQSPVVLGCTDVNNFQCQDFLGALSGPAGNAAGALNYTAGKTKFHDVGVYAQATYKITEQLKLTGGVRYTWDRESNTSQQLSYSGFPPFIATTNPNDPSQPGRSTAVGGPSYVACTYADASNAAKINSNPATSLGLLNLGTDCFRTFKQKSSKPTWLIDLDYTPTDDILVYAKYARGYRSGTIAPNIGGDFAIVQPEKVDSYEVGAKTSFRGAVRGSFNIAGFYNDFSNQQTRLGFNDNPNDALTVTPTASPLNLSRSTIWGIELEASLTPLPGLTFDGSYTYLNTKIKKVPPSVVNNAIIGPYVLSGVPNSGDSLPLSPKHKFSISGTYTLPLEESVGKVSFGATFTSVGKQIANYNSRNYVGCASAGTDLNGNPNSGCLGTSDLDTVAEIRNSGNLPSYHLLNLNANWNAVAGLPVDLSFFMTNVTKEKYVLFTPGLAIGTGLEVETLGMPRMFGGRLRFHFGA